MTRWGEALMHAPCTPVTAFDDELRQLVADMAATMYAADGVGLAANQVGVSLKVFVFDCPDEERQVRTAGVVCNPVLSVPEGRDRNLVESEEGCLSLPGAFVECARPDFASVAGFDQFGEPVAFEGHGLLARCLQHESDHLEGIVFGDRLPNRARKRLIKEADRMADEFPPGWPATS
jgi:peptide deformylase